MAVAVLVGTRVGGRVAVVAVGVVGDVAGGLVAVDVGDGGVAEGVTVGVGVPGADVDGVVLVGGAIAVVVDEVALLEGVGVDVGGGVVAVACDLRVPGGQRAGLLGGAAVTPGVAVEVDVVGGGHVLVDAAVAVVVDLVADLEVAREGLVRGVVAVLVVLDVPGGLGAGVHRVLGVAVAVDIGVGVVRGAHVLVDLAVAVVVDEVADLGVARVGLDVAVVAVVAVGHVPGGGLAGLLGVVGVAEAVAVRVAVVGGGDLLVDEAVTVVVDVVADLGRTRVDGRVVVVAVVFLGEAVLVVVDDVVAGVDVADGIVGVVLVVAGTGKDQDEGEEAEGATGHGRHPWCGGLGRVATLAGPLDVEQGDLHGLSGTGAERCRPLSTICHAARADMGLTTGAARILGRGARPRPPWFSRESRRQEGESVRPGGCPAQGVARSPWRKPPSLMRRLSWWAALHTASRTAAPASR